MELHEVTARTLARMLRAGEVSPREVVGHFLRRIAQAGDGIGAFTVVTADEARARADLLGAEPPTGPLWGVPLGDKDLVARAGVPTRYGSAAFRDNVPSVSDPLAAALDGLGAISLGKTNTSEFGLTGYTEPRVAPPARDPWDPRNGAGGSSGGAAVAVAAGLLPIAPGSDGGGSIRIPAATVGIVGLKPSRGRLPVGSGLDSIAGLAVAGPLARNVGDAAFLLDALVEGAPYRHATSAPHPGPFLPAVAADPRPARIGVTTTSPWDDDVEIALDGTAVAAFQRAATVLGGAGHDIVDADWHPHGYPDLFRTIWRASAARLPVHGPDIDRLEPITAWLIREGRALSPERLLGALSDAAAFERDTIAAFDAFDAVLTPALALAPQPLGWFDPIDAEHNFAQQVQYAPFSSFVNVAGLPAIVLPVMSDATGHPVSVQLIGRPGGEATILSLAAQLERRLGLFPLPHPSALGLRAPAHRASAPRTRARSRLSTRST